MSQRAAARRVGRAAMPLVTAVALAALAGGANAQPLPSPAPALVPAPTPRPSFGQGAAESATETGAESAADNTPDAAPAAAPPRARPDAPASQGRLIPPEEMPPVQPSTTPAATEPETPAGPPAHSSLRETDFDAAACRLGLTMLGARFTDAAPITDPGQRDCGIDRPVIVTEILPGLTLEGGAPMRCDTARALARFSAEILLPAAARLDGAPRLTGLALGSTYQCRGVVGNAESGARISEHALGNAIDIAGFAFDDGRRIEITPPGDRGDLAVAFQNAIQGAACLYFTTVLGPGSNAAHDDHLHLDIKARRGGFRLCQ